MTYKITPVIVSPSYLLLVPRQDKIFLHLSCLVLSSTLSKLLYSCHDKNDKQKMTRFGLPDKVLSKQKDKTFYLKNKQNITIFCIGLLKKYINFGRIFSNSDSNHTCIGLCPKVCSVL